MLRAKEIEIRQVSTTYNLADLNTKGLTEPDVFHFFVVFAPEGVIYALDGEMHNKRFQIYFSCMENVMQL